MDLTLNGQPLHTRCLSVELSVGANGRIVAFAELLDLRKRAFVPVAGKLQPAGIVHHMQLRGVVHEGTGVLESLEADQPAVAFEPSEIAGGESCRDPIGRIRGLVGHSLDDDFSRGVRAEIGGPRGCSHIATLAHLLGSSVQRALHWEKERFADVSRPEGGLVFRRDLAIDGSEIAPGRCQMGLQLTDLHLAPTSGIVRPMDHYAGQFEVRARADVDVTSMEIASAVAAERARDADTLSSAVWRDRGRDVAPLVGQRLVAGVGRILSSQFGGSEGDRPLLDTLLNLTPGLHQCMAVMNEGWALSEAITSTGVGMGGPPDSCYMWRAGGALDRVRTGEADADSAG